MTRSNARELVLHLILDMDYTKDPSAEVVETRLDRDYYATLEAENDVYAERPNQKQLAYIRQVTAGVQEKEAELRETISKYAASPGWPGPFWSWPSMRSATWRTCPRPWRSARPWS